MKPELMLNENYFEKVVYTLFEELYSDRGLQFIIDLAQQIFNKPIVVTDSSYRILSISKHGFEIGSRNYKNQTFQKDIFYMPESIIKDNNIDFIFKSNQSKKEPFIINHLSNDNSWLFTNIFINKIYIGNIGICSSNKSFFENDIKIADALGKIVSLELQKGNFYNINKNALNNYFVIDILQNKIINPKILKTRLQYLTWKPKSKFNICVIDISNDMFSNMKIHITIEKLNSLLPSSIATTYNNFIVCLITYDDDKLLFNDVENYLKDHNLSMGVSNCFNDILKSAIAYNQAVNSIILSKDLKIKKTIHLYKDYIIYNIGDIISQQADLNDFCHPAMLSLLNYDNKHGTLYVTTLYFYLKNLKSPSKTSNELHIHKNTLIYRLNKICELTEVDLNNPNEILLIQLTLKFLNYEPK